MTHNAKRRPQMSLSFMLLMNLVFCILLGALYWASRVPAIADEVSMMLGGRATAGASDNSRRVHIVFLLFTYTAPLLLAGVLSSGLGIWRFVEKRLRSSPTRDDALGPLDR
jgi:hypothetical protein